MAHAPITVMTLLIFTGLFASASFANDNQDARYFCETLLGVEEIAFDAILPDVGLGLLHAFPGSLHLKADRAMAVLENAKSELSPAAYAITFPTPSKPNVAGVEPSQMDQTLKMRSQGKKFSLSSSPNSGNSAFADIFRRNQEEFLRDRPEWRSLVIGFKNIQDFWVEAPSSTYEGYVTEIPLRVLPREWQIRILRRLLKDPPKILEASKIKDLLLLAENTNFSIRGSPPKDPRLGQESPRHPFADNPWSVIFSGGTDGHQYSEGRSLDPKDPSLDYLMRRMLRHYFDPNQPIDEQDLREVYRRHVYFKVAKTDR